MEEKVCSFCTSNENKEREIIRTDLVWAFPTNAPIVPGHVLVCPIRCVATFEELTKAEKDAIFTVSEQIKKSLTKLFRAEGFNHAWNEGQSAGQSVSHFHFHILPRKKGDLGVYEYEPRKFLYRTTGNRETTPQVELIEVAKLIQENL